MSDDRDKLLVLAKLPRAPLPSLEDFILADLTEFAIRLAHSSARMITREIFVGDLVRSKAIEGHVERVLTFVDALRTLSELDAMAFRDQCRREAGLDYEKVWIRVLVKDKRGRRAWVLGHELVVLEGRSS